MKDCHRTLVAALVTVLAAGCAGPTGAPTATTTSAMRQRVPARDLLSLLPADTLGVARVDLADLLERPWVRELFMALLARQTTDQAVQSFFERTEEVIVAFGEHPEGAARAPQLVLMRGRYRPADIESRDPADVPGVYRGHPLHVRQGGAATALLEDHTAISGDVDMVHAALDIVDGVAPANGPQAEAYRAAAARVGLREHAITWVASMRAIVRPRGNPIADSPQVLAFWADVGEELDAGAFLTFSDPSVADIYQNVIDVALQQALADEQLGGAHLAPVFERLMVHVEDGELRAQLSLGPDEMLPVVRALELLIDRPD